MSETYMDLGRVIEARRVRSSVTRTTLTLSSAIMDCAFLSKSDKPHRDNHRHLITDRLLYPTRNIGMFAVALEIITAKLIVLSAASSIDCDNLVLRDLEGA